MMKEGLIFINPANTLPKHIPEKTSFWNYQTVHVNEKVFKSLYASAADVKSDFRDTLIVKVRPTQDDK